MKKGLLIAIAAFLAVQAQGQQVVITNPDAPVKLSDLAEEYFRARSQSPTDENEEEKEGKHVKEGKDHHFGRWYWYWQSHTDQDGYIVPQTKNFEEWKKLKGRAQNKTTAADMSDWKFQGPNLSFSGYGGIGRINKVSFHPTDPNTYWVCTAGGGVWKTSNNGLAWTQVAAELPVLGTSDFDVNPQNPNTQYLCTGDRDANDSYSIGVMKSVDGGQTWTSTGMTFTTSQLRLTNSLEINAVDTNSLTLATSNGIYKSYNGGTTWAQRQAGNFKQVLYHPTDTSILYAATYGTSAAHVYRSANGGATWTQITTLQNKRRITLAVTAADVKIVKAIAITSNGGLDGIYNSSDTGKTFTKIYGPSGCNGDLISGQNTNPANINSCGGQGWYDLTIAIDPANASEVIVGGVNAHYSTNGGTSWNIATQWWSQLGGIATVHADKHWHAYHPLVPGRVFECNDGGIYYSDNIAGQLWTDVSDGLGITQFYRNAVVSNTTMVIGGAQDNGSKKLQGFLWGDETGGDGMDCQIDPVDSNVYYTATQYGDNIYRSDGANIANNVPGSQSGAWITPYIISPHDPAHLIVGYKELFFSSDYGDTWTTLTGGNLDHNNKNFVRLAMTPASDSTIYAVSDNSRNVYFTHNFVPGNVAAFDSVKSPYNGSITDIEVDPFDRNHFWVTLGGYNSGQVAEYKSGTWKQINAGLPNVPVHCFEYDSSYHTIYVGTDLGVFYQDSFTNNQWMPFNKNLPSIEVADLGINYTTGELWAATYGRGMWSSVKQGYAATADTTDTTTAIAIIPFASDPLTVMPNPNEGQFSVKTSLKQLFGREAYIDIMDNTGKVVLRRKDGFDENGLIRVSANGLPVGIYVLQVRDNEKVIGRKRIIIQ